MNSRLFLINTTGDISSNVEKVSLEYESTLHNHSLLDLFELNRLKDQQVGHTTAGFTETIWFYHSTSSHQKIRITRTTENVFNRSEIS